MDQIIAETLFHLSIQSNKPADRLFVMIEDAFRGFLSPKGSIDNICRKEEQSRDFNKIPELSIASSDSLTGDYSRETNQPD